MIMIMMKKKRNIIMVTNINRFLGFFWLLAAFSCSDFTGENTGAHNLDQVAILKVGGVHAVDVGPERFLLDGVADNSGYSGHNFHLRFRLPVGAQLKFFFFAAKKNLAGGVEFLWMRSSEGKVVMEISLNGKTHRHRLPLFDHREEIDLDLDVHNNHSDIHILVWEKSGSRGNREDCTFDGGCLYNTEDFAFDAWLGVGRASGVHWGVQGDTDLILSLEGPFAPESNV